MIWKDDIVIGDLKIIMFDCIEFVKNFFIFDSGLKPLQSIHIPNLNWGFEQIETMLAILDYYPTSKFSL